MTIADKIFTAPWDIYPQAATGQELGHAANLWDLFTREVTFNAASGANVITVPDNVASAVEWVDAGGIEYMRVDTQNAQPVVVWNEGGADVDFRWEASGVDPALFIQGSDGFIGLNNSAPLAQADIISTQSENLYVQRYQPVATGANIKFWRARGTPAVPVVLNVSDQIAYFEGRGYVRNAADAADAFVNLSRVVFTIDSLDPQGRAASRIGWFTGSGVSAVATEKMRLDPDGRLGINMIVPAAQTHIDQSSLTGAIPVLSLDQADLSEEMINFLVAATGAGNPVDTATAVGAPYARLRIGVNGVFKYIQLYNA